MSPMSRQNAKPEADAAAEDIAAPARWPATGSGPVSATPAANAAGWNSSDVTVDWNWSDTGAGLDPAISTQQSTSSGEGTIDLSASCTDLAGNTATATYTVKVVLTDPTVTITVPQDGTQHQVGQNVVADFSCADAVSGIDTCTDPGARWTPPPRATSPSPSPPPTWPVDKPPQPSTRPSSPRRRPRRRRRRRPPRHHPRPHRRRRPSRRSPKPVSTPTGTRRSSDCT